MPTFNVSITGFVAGDDIEIERTVSGFPTGQGIVKAWLTIKENIDDDDVDAVVQKEITITNVPGTGFIVNDGAASGVAIVRFDLIGDDTILLYNVSRGSSGFPYDIQVKTSAGKIYTPEIGTILGVAQVTRDRT